MARITISPMFVSQLSKFTKSCVEGLIFSSHLGSALEMPIIIIIQDKMVCIPRRINMVKSTLCFLKYVAPVRNMDKYSINEIKTRVKNANDEIWMFP